MRNNHIYGLIVGLFGGIIDGLLIFFIDPSAPILLYLQVLTSWTVIGWTVVNTQVIKNHYLHGVLVSVVSVIPWLLSELVHSHKTEYIIPYFILATIFGLLFGYCKKRNA